MPAPAALVVKNGSKRCLATSSSIPWPVSETASRTCGPAAPSPCWATCASSTSTLAVSIVSAPPPGIASRALAARLRITRSIWARSASIGARSGASRMPTLTSSPMIRCSIVSMPSTIALRSSTFGCSTWRRLKASSWCVSAAAWSAAREISRRLLAAVALAEDLGVAGDHRQQVVEVVRDAARQAPDRLHLLGVREPPLEPLALADVVREHERGALALERDPPGADLDVDDRAVLAAVAPGVRARRARSAFALDVVEQRAGCPRAGGCR